MRKKVLYYKDMSVLPKYRQLIFSIRNYYEWDIFHILSSEDIADVIPLFFLFFYFRDAIKRKLHVGLNIWSLSYKINFICSRHRVISSVYFHTAQFNISLLFAHGDVHPHPNPRDITTSILNTSHFQTTVYPIFSITTSEATVLNKIVVIPFLALLWSD